MYIEISVLTHGCIKLILLLADEDDEQRMSTPMRWNEVDEIS